MQDYDVLILGAGPTGATLANALRNDGHKVAIFDRDKEAFHAPRAMGLDDESLRILNQCGLYHDLSDGFLPISDMRFTNKKRKRLMSMRPSEIDGQMGYPFANLFHQVKFDTHLRNCLRDGVDTFFGWEVARVEDTGESAVLVAKNTDTDEVKEFRGQFVVGCDGGASITRRTMKAGRIDLGYSEDFFVMDALVADEAYFDSIPDGGEQTCDPERPLLIFKGVDGHMRFDRKRANNEPLEAFETYAKELIGKYFDADQFEIIRIAPYTFYASTSDSWRKGRLLIVGDAAHQTPPWAGQGLNSGLRDVINLRFKLDFVLKGKASGALLDTYQEERLVPAQDTIRGAMISGKMFTLKNPLLVALRNSFFFLARTFEAIPRYFLSRVLIQRPPYPRGSGLTGMHPLAGHLSIQPEVETPSGESGLMDDVIGSGFVLLSKNPVDSDLTDKLAAAVGARSLVINQGVIDRHGKLTAWLDAHDANCVLLRPDKYVYSAGKSAEALCEEFLDQWSKYAPVRPDAKRSTGSVLFG